MFLLYIHIYWSGKKKTKLASSTAWQFMPTLSFALEEYKNLSPPFKKSHNKLLAHSMDDCCSTALVTGHMYGRTECKVARFVIKPLSDIIVAPSITVLANLRKRAA